METRDRITYIGGGDAAAILGLSRWRTPLGVWALKTGQVISQDISQKVPVKLGVKLEQAVAEFFEDELKKKVYPITEEAAKNLGLRYFIRDEDNQKKVTFMHPRYDFLGATIDRVVEGELAGLECKTTSAYKTREWEGEQIPIENIFQCLHYMAVTGWPKWYIAALIGNMVFDWKLLVRKDYTGDLSGIPKERLNLIEPKVLDDLVAKEVVFWNNFVLPKVMPMTITPEDGGILYRLYPIAAEESVIELGDEVNAIIETLDAMQADYKSLEADIDRQKNELRARLKTFETGMTNKYRITWKNEPDNRLDIERLKKEEPGIYEKFMPTDKTKRVLRFSIRKY